MTPCTPFAPSHVLYLDGESIPVHLERGKHITYVYKRHEWERGLTADMVIGRCGLWDRNRLINAWAVTPIDAKAGA